MLLSVSWRQPCLVTLSLLAIILTPCWALRPGGDDGIALTSVGSIVLNDGSIVEDHELRESNPVLAKFVNIGSASHKLLQKSGYAYGALVGIAHSDRDKQYGEGPNRQEWFPMVIALEVLEAGAADEVEDVTVQYEVSLDYDPKGVASPGLVILEARKLGADGAVAVTLEVLPPEPNSFIERNKGGIMMFLGVITASGIVKFVRLGFEKLLKAVKKWSNKGESETGDPATATDTTKTAKPFGEAQLADSKRKAKGGNTKED